MSYNIVVLIRIHENKDVEYVTKAVYDMARQCVKVSGCARFEVQQCINSNTILLIEFWDNYESFKAFNSSPAFVKFIEDVLVKKTEREVFVTETLLDTELESCD